MVGTKTEIYQESLSAPKVRYRFERRRYGTGPSMRFYTWLLYIVNDGTKWETYGDPWPKVRLSRKELLTALADISDKARKAALSSETDPRNL